MIASREAFEARAFVLDLDITRSGCDQDRYACERTHGAWIMYQDCHSVMMQSGGGRGLMNPRAWLYQGRQAHFIVLRETPIPNKAVLADNGWTEVELFDARTVAAAVAKEVARLTAAPAPALSSG